MVVKDAKTSGRPYNDTQNQLTYLAKWDNYN